jgi:hypothetical protein
VVRVGRGATAHHPSLRVGIMSSATHNVGTCHGDTQVWTRRSALLLGNIFPTASNPWPARAMARKASQTSARTSRPATAATTPATASADQPMPVTMQCASLQRAKAVGSGDQEEGHLHHQAVDRHRSRCQCGPAPLRRSRFRRPRRRCRSARARAGRNGSPTC